MTPIVNLFEAFIDKFIVHIPEEHKEAFREGAKVLIPLIVEAGAKGASEGLKNG